MNKEFSYSSYVSKFLHLVCFLSVTLLLSCSNNTPIRLHDSSTVKPKNPPIDSDPSIPQFLPSIKAEIPSKAFVYPNQTILLAPNQGIYVNGEFESFMLINYLLNTMLHSLRMKLLQNTMIIFS